MTEETPRLSRRKFLKTAGAAVGVITLTALAGCTPEFESLDIQTVDGNKVYINKEGLPTKIETRDGKTVHFDREEMKSVKERAMRTKEPEVAGVVDIKTPRQKSNIAIGSEEYPRIMQPTENRMTPEELAIKGITIIQPENTKLYIRKGAFENGMPFAGFADGKRKLTIAIIDSPYLVLESFKDSKYDPVRNAIERQGSYITPGKLQVNGQDHPFTLDPAVVNQVRQEKINETTKNLGLFRSLPVNDKLYKKKQGEDKNYWVLSCKLEIKALENKIYTDEDIALTGVGQFYQGLYHEQKYGEDQAVVFLAVSSRVPRDLFSVYFDENGKIQTFTAKADQDNTNLAAMNTGANIRIEDIYPNGTMPAKNRTEPGWNLRHELLHDTYQDNDAIGYDEDKINELVGNELKDAKQTWQDTNFGKNDKNGDWKYCFEWELPQNEGGFIRT